MVMNTRMPHRGKDLVVECRRRRRSEKDHTRRRQSTSSVAATGVVVNAAAMVTNPPPDILFFVAGVAAAAAAAAVVAAAVVAAAAGATAPPAAEPLVAAPANRFCYPPCHQKYRTHLHYGAPGAPIRDDHAAEAASPLPRRKPLGRATPVQNSTLKITNTFTEHWPLLLMLMNLFRRNSPSP